MWTHKQCKTMLTHVFKPRWLVLILLSAGNREWARDRGGWFLSFALISALSSSSSFSLCLSSLSPFIVSLSDEWSESRMVLMVCYGTVHPEMLRRDIAPAESGHEGSSVRPKREFGRCHGNVASPGRLCSDWPFPLFYLYTYLLNSLHRLSRSHRDRHYHFASLTQRPNLKHPHHSRFRVNFSPRFSRHSTLHCLHLQNPIS